MRAATREKGQAGHAHPCPDSVPGLLITRFLLPVFSFITPPVRLHHAGRRTRCSSSPPSSPSATFGGHVLGPFWCPSSSPSSFAIRPGPWPCSRPRGRCRSGPCPLRHRRLRLHFGLVLVLAFLCIQSLREVTYALRDAALRMHCLVRWVLPSR